MTRGKSRVPPVQQIGLILFSFVVGANTCGLALDAALLQCGMPTVTEFSRRNPWAATFIILLNVVGLVGLVLHFSNGHK